MTSDICIKSGIGAAYITHRMLDDPVFQFQEQGFRAGYFNLTFNTAGASDMPGVTMQKLCFPSVVLFS
jgi:hypothetical protein